MSKTDFVLKKILSTESILEIKSKKTQHIRFRFWKDSATLS